MFISPSGKNLRTQLVLKRFNWIVEKFQNCLLPTQLPCRTCKGTCSSYNRYPMSLMFDTYMYMYIFFMYLNKSAYWDDNIVYCRYHAVDNRLSKKFQYRHPYMYYYSYFPFCQYSFITWWLWDYKVSVMCFVTHIRPWMLWKCPFLRKHGLDPTVQELNFRPNVHTLDLMVLNTKYDDYNFTIHASMKQGTWHVM